MESVQNRIVHSGSGHAVLRWLAVIPGGALAALAAAFPVHWMVMLQYSRPYRTQVHAFIDHSTLQSLVGGFVLPFVFIVVGAKIAPRIKFRTAVALSVLLVPFFVVGLIFAAGQIRQGLYDTVGSFITLGINILLWVAAVYAALRVAKEM